MICPTTCYGTIETAVVLVVAAVFTRIIGIYLMPDMPATKPPLSD